MPEWMKQKWRSLKWKYTILKNRIKYGRYYV